MILNNFESFLQFQRRVLGLWRINISVSNIRTPFGEPFDKSNHWVKTLEEYDRGITDFKQTTLYEFHQKFQPKSVFDIIEDRANPSSYYSELYPLGNYPWSRWVQPLTKNRWFKGRHCGPSAIETIENEYYNFIALYKNIQKEGLKLRKYGHPVGLMLVDDRDIVSKYYYLVLGGNHRVAVAAHLGITHIKVRLFSRFYIDKQIIKFSDIQKMEHEDCEESKNLFKHLVHKGFIFNDH
jgi:hypothetical protein